jgi:hypothetical protein
MTNAKGAHIVLKSGPHSGETVTNKHQPRTSWRLTRASQNAEHADAASTAVAAAALAAATYYSGSSRRNDSSYCSSRDQGLS